MSLVGPVQRLIQAMRRYDHIRNKDCWLRDSLVPKNQLEAIKRIHRWSGEIIKRQENNNETG